MFDFFKKSRAFKFLCSACLLCSLGAFVNVNAEEPTKIADVYVQGPLGFESNHIALYNNAKINASGLMSDGFFKWKTITYSKGTSTNNKTLNEAWDTLRGTVPTLDKISATLNSAGYDVRFDNGFYIWYDVNSEVVLARRADEQQATLSAWFAWLNLVPDHEKRHYLLNLNWREEISYSNLQNSNENSKLALFLKSGNDYVGATEEIDLTNKDFSLGNVQFYNSTTGDVIKDESSATPLSCKPGVYDVMGILTEKGDKTIISGPVLETTNESP